MIFSYVNRFKYALIFVFFYALSFALTKNGYTNWDTVSQANQSEWLWSHYIGPKIPLIDKNVVWYGPLWELILGIPVFVFKFLKDPIWVRSATTFFLFPITLFFAFRAFRKYQMDVYSAALGCLMLVGIIRWSGHALFNTKDFPAACTYLLLTLYLPLFFDRIFRNKSISPFIYFILGACSLVPYLIRPPNLAHFLGLFLLLVFKNVFFTEPSSRKTGFLSAISFFAGGIVFMYLVWPPLWTEGVNGFVNSFAFFIKYPTDGPLRVMGLETQASNLAWWYTLLFIPISIDPTVFVAFIFGALIQTKNLWKDLRTYPIFTGEIVTRSMPVWLFIFGVLPWLAFVIITPVFCDDERHFLWVFPVLVLYGFWGLSDISLKVKKTLLVVCSISLIWSFSDWRNFSYIYKSPLVPRTGSLYNGEYYGICTSEAIQELINYSNQKSETEIHVLIPGWGPTAHLEKRRRETSVLYKKLNQPVMSFGENIEPGKPNYLLSYSRYGFHVRREFAFQDSEKILAENKGDLIWESRLNPGELRGSCRLIRLIQ